MKFPPRLALLSLFVATALQAAGPIFPYESQVELFQVPPFSDQIDRAVFGKLKALGIPRANLCSDSVFIRRAYLDLLGTLPTADEATVFLANSSPQKRSDLIDELLERKEYAEYWGMRWGDVLRVKSEFPVNLWPNAAQAYDRWIRECLRKNVPYSKFASDLLTASGSNFKNPPVNFYRSAGSKDSRAIARMVALTFLGQRSEKWPEYKQRKMSIFFSRIGYKGTTEWKEEIVYYDGMDTENANPFQATFPDGAIATLQPGQDPREIFTKWLMTSKNSNFAACAVNRIWYWLLGRGIVHEPDDFREDNPPSNPYLLELLSKEFVDSGYDMKNLCRAIMNSNVYQLSSIPPANHPKAAANFAFYPIRRMDAEVIIDAVNQITGSQEEYSSMIPEPYSYIPEDKRSITLPDGSITSSFLEIFGRPPRDSGILSERVDRTSTSQRLHMLNSTHILNKLNKSEFLKEIYKNGSKTTQSANKLYLTFLSRYPTEEEMKTIQAYSQNSEAKGGWKSMQDLAWALLNSPEFVFRH